MNETVVKEEQLVDPDGGPVGSLDALLSRCLSALTARIWGTCSWPDAFGLWTVGDYRFLIVELNPSEDTSLYIQFWSEPGEPVLVEVSSGYRNPGALEYVWHEQRRALHERGFSIGGRARNYQKTMAVQDPEDAERLAREALAIVFDVFGYRGHQPLTVTTRRDRRGRLDVVNESLTPEDFIKLARQAGFRAQLVDGETGTPTIALRKGDFHSMAVLRLRTPRANLFGAAALQTVLRGPSSAPAERLPMDPAAAVPMKIVELDDGRVIAETSLLFAGGVTAAWIIGSLERWRIGARRLRRLIAKGRKRPIEDDAPSSRVSVH